MGNEVLNHNSSFVHPGAKVADTVKIDPFVTIYDDVEIGDGTWIGSNVVIHSGARIGKQCRIFPGAVISSIPQDMKFRGEYTTVEIGNKVTIREFVTVNRGTADKFKTVVGDNVLLMAYSHIAHDCIIGKSAILANAVTMAGHVEIDEYAIVGGMSAIHQFVKIGKHVMISGGSLVRKDIPPYTKAAREPLGYEGINSIGLRRRGFTPEQINLIQDIYRIIFLAGLNYSQAVAKVELEFPPTPERDEILEFIRRSERGIMKGYSGV